MFDIVAPFLALGVPMMLTMVVGGTPPGPYEKIFFRREGGGNKAFYVKADESQGLLSFDVVRYGFRDTSYTFQRAPETKDDVCKLLSSILSGRLNVAGDVKHVNLPTGTWAHLYAVTSTGSLVEITDPKLRDRLMVLEKLVEAQRSDPNR